MRNSSFEKYYVEKKMNQYDDVAKDFMNADLGFNDVTRKLMYDYLDFTSLKRQRVLDVGYGYGQDIELFSKLGADVFGIDSSKELIFLAEQRCPKANLTVGNFENLPYRDNYFNVVFSRYAIQHSEKSGKVLEEIARVLKPNGEAMVLVTHPLRQYFEKKTKDYWHEENVVSNILDGKLVVTEPSHTFEDYLNKDVLGKMSLMDVKEHFDPAAEKINGCGIYPGVLVIHFRK
jgi:ubiquinone/menaquinone biosynthesis C-methylase UbiE